MSVSDEQITNLFHHYCTAIDGVRAITKSEFILAVREFEAAGNVEARIEEHGLCVFHPEKRKGDGEKKWTVRKEDANGNTISQHRDDVLRRAVARVVADLTKFVIKDCYFTAGTATVKRHA